MQKNTYSRSFAVKGSATRRICMISMMSALCTVLSFVSVTFGGIKITFESFPVLLGALMFGPLDGMIVGFIGTLLYQLLSYGVTVTTLLWILPYAAVGFALGMYAKLRRYSMGQVEMISAVLVCEVLITVLNTAAFYLDSIVYDYYSFVLIFGSVPFKLLLCVIKGVVFGTVLPRLVGTLERRGI